MSPIQVKLAGCQVDEGCGEHVVAEPDFADFMQQPSNKDFMGMTAVQAQSGGDVSGQVGNTPGVSRQIATSQVDQRTEHLDRRDEVVFELLMGTLQRVIGDGEFAGALCD